LWNYAPAPEDLAGVLVDIPADADARAIALALVDFALANGGHDDITVGVAVF